MEIADGILNNWDCGCRSGAPLTPSLTLKESLTDAPLASRSPVETPKMADDDAPLSKELVAESLMVDGLTEAEHEATKQFLEEVGRCTENEDNEPIAWHTAVKFLMARKFDVRRAVDLYLNHELTRKREGVGQIDPWEEIVQSELLTGKFTVLPGRDDSGAALALFTVKLHHPPQSTHQAVLKALIFQLDAALAQQETQRNGLVFIYDMTGSKYRNNFDYDLSIKILNMLKGSYPARLKKVLIVTAPLWFKAPFKILRLFVREKLRDRVFTVNLGQLMLHIPPASLPKQFQGKMDFSHQEWIRKCLQIAWNKPSANDNEINAYFESYENHVLPRLLSVSSQASSTVTTPTGDESSFFGSSDMESSTCSRNTVHEKQNHEGLEKGDGDTDGDNDDSGSGGGDFRFGDGDMDTATPSPTSPALLAADISSTPRPVSWPNHVTNSASSPDARRRGAGKGSGAAGRPASTGHAVQVKRSSESSLSHSSDGDLDLSNPPPLPRKKRPTSSDDDGSLHKGEAGGLTIKELVEYCRIKRRLGLYKEYARIKMEPPAGTFEHSKAKPNLPKNRYTDVLCLDHSRVVLDAQEGDPHSDYINANFVDGYKHKAAYISSQGPLPRTFAHFWQMIWEQTVLLIVMTTRTVELSRLKCGQYWPKETDEAEEYGNFVVINNGMIDKTDYIVTSLILRNNRTDETREVTHFQFVGWHDYAVPHCAQAFFDFMWHVRRCQADRTGAMGDAWTGHPEGPPLVVHCSAGIGRTGTFITVDINTRRLADVGTVDIQQTVRRIRSQRAFSIQMPDQYVFCHLALIEHAQRQNLITAVDLDKFEDSSSDSE